MTLAIPLAVLVHTVEAQGGELTTPDAAGVEGVDVLYLNLTEGRPVAKEDFLLLAFALGVIVPGVVVFDLRAGSALIHQVEPALGVAVTHAGKAVTDKTQAVHTFEVIVPGGWFIAIHDMQKVVVAIGVEDGFQFMGVGLGLSYGPHGIDTGMHHGQIKLLVVME